MDGVVTPVHPTKPTWGDEVGAGNVLGRVLVSPTLCRALDSLNDGPVKCWWLTDWSVEMRARMDPFPGRAWSDAGVRAYTEGSQNWWKLDAVRVWMEIHPEVRAVAWVDDHLRGGRANAAHRLFTNYGAEAFLMSPRTEVGLTPAGLDRLESWLDRSPGTPI